MDGANTTTIPHAIASYYDRVLLARAKPYLVHTNFGQVRPLPMNSSDTIKFRKYGALTVATTPLTEMQTPAGSSASVTDITATALWYGDYIPFSDKVQYESPDKVLTELYEVLAEQGGQTVDILARNVLVAGTNVLYAGSANTATGDVAAGDVITTTLLDTAEATLLTANAMYMTKVVSPDAGYATQPLSPSYVAIVHPMQKAKLQALTGWIPVRLYQNKGDVMMNEIGTYGNIRFVISTQAKVKTGEGTGAVNIYTILIFGKDAYGVTAMQGHGMESITKPLGSAGAADPLNQRGTVGWKANHVTKILNQSYMLRIEHALV